MVLHCYVFKNDRLPVGESRGAQQVSVFTALWLKLKKLLLLFCF